MADRVKLDNPVRLGLAPDNLFRLGVEHFSVEKIDGGCYNQGNHEGENEPETACL